LPPSVVLKSDVCGAAAQMGQSGPVGEAASAIAVLSARDRLPGRPRRVLVCGTSGSGKTTIAGRISAMLNIPHVRIDALFHGPNWQPLDSFLDDVATLAEQPSWVTEWQYGDARPLLLKRADMLVSLDLPRSVVMRQVIARTLRRRLRREELWNGNIEPPLRTFLTDREHIVRWAWSTHHGTAERVAAARQERPDMPIVRLTSWAAAVDLLTGPLAAAAQPPASPALHDHRQDALSAERGESRPST
jgi:adenylate kinase family enzyme